MAKFLADGKKKLVMLSSAPAGIATDTILTSEATAGTDISAMTLAPCNLGPSGSDTVDEKSLADQGNAQTFGASNYQGRSITLFRYFDESTLQPDGTEDAAYTALKEKGTTVRFLTRESAKDSTAAFADGDEVNYVEYTTDEPQETEGDGYIKSVIPLAYAGTSARNVVLST